MIRDTLPKSILSTLVLVAVVGCKSIGPGAVKRDRLHYATAVADSWKEQLLLNIVKTRYGDAPGFLEVVSVVSGYSLETGVSLNGEFSPESLRGDTFAAAGVSSKYTDRPTISYSPMSGARFARSLMAPVPLEPVMFVIQGGVPADFIMGLTVKSIEGHQNGGMFGQSFQPADAEFGQLLHRLRVLQQANVIESAIVAEGDHEETWIRFHPAAATLASTTSALAELKRELNIPAHLDRAKIVFGTRVDEPGVIAIRTRSLMQVLGTLGAGVEIPEEHVAAGAVLPVDGSVAFGGFKVRCSKDKPDEAFVEVPYEGFWFWIDRNDLASKTTLATVTMLFNFLEGGDTSAPVLTIPTN